MEIFFHPLFPFSRTVSLTPPARNKCRRKDLQDGFTLIELLVVILIIAILASLAIPIFLRQRERGWLAAAESSLKDAATAAESYQTRNGNYAGLSAAELDEEGWNPTDAVEITLYLTADANGFCLEANHSRLENPDLEPIGYSTITGRPQRNFPCDPAVYGDLVGVIS
ncbi:MAG TPA: prepilin-type N-terminal cleavage/methylation domain-containing protein [Actinomycetota bacterium]|nr:prepilin-type N-terminal cleavage/methylation domain-containing protein [Actinomycetota bacterium]